MFAAGDDAPVAALCRARQGAGDHSGDSNGDEHARFDEREAGLCGEFGGGVSVKTYGRLRYGNFQGTRVWGVRSEEHTSELQSLMRISYAVFCLKKKINKKEDNRVDIRCREIT